MTRKYPVELNKAEWITGIYAIFAYLIMLVSW